MMTKLNSQDLEIYIDGASKGNPVHSGIGIVIFSVKEVIKNLSRYIGQATNNVAEYTALIYALQESLLLKADNIKINTDSELLSRQLNKIYKVKNPNIQCLYSQATRLMSGFKKVSVNHIRREENAEADRLATKAVKEALQGRP
ncbi:MAG: ribonuclease HI family protein [Candidatus Omnitrophica bacterium]|nr:ribonuclease HI family protein [Candidatus Omnitrophota bacterium]